jgi:hypothetical protein
MKINANKPLVITAGKKCIQGHIEVSTFIFSEWI